MIDTDASKPDLSDLALRTDAEVVRIWLAERGFVAVRRQLAEGLAKPGNEQGVYYDQTGDYYDSKKYADVSQR